MSERTYPARTGCSGVGRPVQCIRIGNDVHKHSAVGFGDTKRGQIVFDFVKRTALVAAVVGAMATGSEEAEAAIITHDFTANAISVSGGLTPTLNAGQTLTGSFSYDDSASGSPQDAFRTEYLGAITAVSLSIGGLSWTFDPAGPVNTIEIADNSSGSDTFFANASISGPQINGFTPDSFSLLLEDSLNGQAFDSQDIPPSLDLADFPNATTILLNFFSPDGNEFGIFSLTSLELRSLVPTAVSEPAGLAVFTLGLFLLAAASVRRTRQVS